MVEIIVMNPPAKSGGGGAEAQLNNQKKTKKKTKPQDGGYREKVDMMRKLVAKFGGNIDEWKRFIFKGEQTITITMGDVGENHVDMQKIGKLAKRGYSIEELERFKVEFEALGAKCFMANLNVGLVDTEYEGKGEEARVLVIKKGVDKILGVLGNCDNLLVEVDKDKWMDDKIYSVKHKRVVSKNARFNNCFGPEDLAQDPDYENKKGTVIGYDKVPLLKAIVDWFNSKNREIMGEEDAAVLVGETNKYYLKICGIGAHGDAERKIANGIRLGATIPLGYRWRIGSKGVGKLMRFDDIEHGDMYMMSYKATGYDWKKRSKLTLVHAAGAAKYMKQLEK